MRTQTHKHYAHYLAEAQASFVGACAESLYSYVRALHSQARVDLQADIPLLQDWDWGTPSFQDGAWRCRIWSKDHCCEVKGRSGTWLVPNLLVVVTLDAARVSVKLVMDNVTTLATLDLASAEATPSHVGMQLGAVWERALSGRLVRGRFDL